MSSNVPSTIRFGATLTRVEDSERTEASLAVVLPKAAITELPSTDATMVEGTINGFPFRSALEVERKQHHSLRVNPALQAAAGAAEGEPVSVEITRVGEEPECRVPVDLREALATRPAAAQRWEEITPLARRDWTLWISSAKQADTRRGRIAKACSMLASGKRRPCCFGGLGWLVKDHLAAGETWIDLPNAKRRGSAKSSR